MTKLDLMVLQNRSSDFGDSDAFMVPVIKAYGQRPLFRFYGDSEHGWDWENISGEIGGSIVRSSTSFCPESGKLKREALFDLGGLVFVQIGVFSMMAYAPTREDAQKAYKDFFDRFAKPPSPPGPCYHLIVQGPYGFESMQVNMDSSRIPPADSLDLFYGEGFVDWLARFEGLLGASKGLSILEGTPGTGKTSLIRHVISRLAQTHRFYFIPSIFAASITDPDFVSFWEGQRRRHPNFQFVCIFEDAEASLMTRGIDNRRRVEAILNMTDGLLSDFLRIQVVCTINCKTSEIDPALMRPGRLIAHRAFGRLSAATARKIAERFGRTLESGKRDYSLAEIFNEDESRAKAARVGFQAQEKW